MRIGDVEGTVIHLGVLSTKVKTLRQEEITIPNVVVVSQTTTDYSRSSDSEGVFTPTSVTIGYDTPWRQVHALLLLAAERTAGLRRDPKPVVLQAGLEDFYVKYTLFISLERQQARPFVLERARTRTSRICSTSTASRSCRRTTSSIPRRRRRCPRRAGSPRRLARTRPPKVSVLSLCV